MDSVFGFCIIITSSLKDFCINPVITLSSFFFISDEWEKRLDLVLHIRSIILYSHWKKMNNEMVPMYLLCMECLKDRHQRQLAYVD